MSPPSPFSRCRDARRSAFTLIEVLAVLAVIGILVALLLPAVQAAREAARRVQCEGNLRQFGIALNAYAAAHEVFPAGSDWNGHSLHSILLPHLEQGQLFNALNFGFAPDDASLVNETVSATSLSVFICPSDGARFDQGWTNYAGSTGVGYQIHREDNGVFAGRTVEFRHRFIGPRHITDGLSSTVAMSEWIMSIYDLRDARRSVFDAPALNGPDEFDRFAAACHGLDVQAARLAWPGKVAPWVNSGMGTTLYNHVLPPGGHSCLNGGGFEEGAWTAGSNHRGGTNTLFADGHIRSLGDSIDRAVWRALGTRNGKEAISDDSY